MNQNDRRLAEVYRSLSAVERGRMALQAWKDDRDPEAEVRESMPSWQADQFNRLVGVLRASQAEIAWYGFWLLARIETVQARVTSLLAMRLWALGMSQAAGYIGFCTKEPITENEYARRVAEASAELVPADAFAEILTEEDEDAPGLSGRRYAARQREHLQRLKAAFASGELKGRRVRGGPLIEAGSFYAWRGEALVPAPQWAPAYDVRPDSAGRQVEMEAASREVARRAVSAAPHWLTEGSFDPGDNQANEIAKATAARAGLELLEIWSELLALDAVVASGAADFEGDEPLHPETRAVLEQVRGGCRWLGEEVEQLGVVLEWPEEGDGRVVEALTALIKGRQV